jgi:hypothetical protein
VSLSQNFSLGGRNLKTRLRQAKAEETRNSLNKNQPDFVTDLITCLMLINDDCRQPSNKFILA